MMNGVQQIADVTHASHQDGEGGLGLLEERFARGEGRDLRAKALS